jgi:hypothetical protein
MISDNQAEFVYTQNNPHGFSPSGSVVNNSFATFNFFQDNHVCFLTYIMHPQQALKAIL